MKDIIEMWKAIRPQTKEEKIEFVKTVGKTIILAVIGMALIYFGCLFS
jgi:Sec-independent protein secretion pathway component TatC